MEICTASRIITETSIDNPVERLVNVQTWFAGLYRRPGPDELIQTQYEMQTTFKRYFHHSTKYHTYINYFYVGLQGVDLYG